MVHFLNTFSRRFYPLVMSSLQALGGNGYVEDFPLARLFRQSPLNSVWEGSGNVMALDIVRGHKSLPALFRDIKSVAGSDQALDRYISNLERSIAAFARDPSSSLSQKGARNLVDRLAVAMQGSIMIRFGDPKVSER
jgi:putative acyl-CoA dehydrogenase